MNANTKLEIAVEIMAAKIAKTSREDNSEEKLKELLKEKTKMYQGDKEIIEKIIHLREHISIEKIHNLLKEEHVPINLSKMMKQIKQMS